MIQILNDERASEWVWNNEGNPAKTLCKSIQWNLRLLRAKFWSGENWQNEMSPNCWLNSVFLLCAIKPFEGHTHCTVICVAKELILGLSFRLLYLFPQDGILSTRRGTYMWFCWHQQKKHVTIKTRSYARQYSLLNQCQNLILLYLWQ